MTRKRQAQKRVIAQSGVETFNRALESHGKGKLDKAEKLYRALLKKQPKHGGALVNLGQLLRQQGRHEDALAQYQKAAALPDAPYEAWFNLANTQVSCKQFADAKTSLLRALELNPDAAQAHYQLGCVYKRQDRLQDSISCFATALKKNAGLVSAYLDKGNSHRALGQTQQAIDSYQGGLNHTSNDWRLHYSLARIFDQQQDDRFENHFNKAIQYAPDPWSIYFGLAETRVDDRNYAGAEGLYRKCLELKPDQLQAAIGLGAVLMRLDRRAEGEPFFHAAAKNDDIRILSKLATVIWEHKFFDEAIELLQKIVQLEPERFDTHLNLAKAYVQNWNLDTALSTLDKAVSYDPGNKAAIGLKAAILSKQGRVDESIAAFREEYQLDTGKRSSLSSIAFCSLYSDRLTVAEKAKLHRELGENLHQPREIRFTNEIRKDKHLRIGYVSADFRDQHPVGIFILPIIEQHDRDRFEVFCYYNSQTWDKSTHRIHDTTDHWQDIVGWSDERLTGVITNNQIDILVDLSGHTAHHRLSLFGSRAAPVQVTMIGYPHSTGLPSMDYLIADTWVCPAENDPLCTETIERLPLCIFNYLPEDKYGSVNVKAAEQRKHVVFGSFNNIPKVTPSTIKLWAEVLKAVPDALLKLKAPSFLDAGCQERYNTLFEKEDIDRKRLQIVGPTELIDMMQEYRDIDIALDPIPYKGGTTTVQALWMGVPVITLAGENFCGRMGISILTNVGLPELIAQTKEQYIEIAKSLAEDKAHRLSMRSTLREKMKSSPLCDSETYTRELETIYRRIWHTYCGSHSP